MHASSVAETRGIPSFALRCPSSAPIPGGFARPSHAAQGGPSAGARRRRRGPGRGRGRGATALLAPPVSAHCCCTRGLQHPPALAREGAHRLCRVLRVERIQSTPASSACRCPARDRRLFLSPSLFHSLPLTVCVCVSGRRCRFSLSHPRRRSPPPLPLVSPLVAPCTLEGERET